MKPFKGEETSELTTLSLITMVGRSFPKNPRVRFVIFVIPSRIGEIRSTNSPIRSAEIAKQYSDLTPSDLPIVLLPSRGIIHQIDVILDANIPNQADYRTTLEY